MTDVEFSLLAACCRWCYSREGEADIRRLSSEADWARLVRLADRHRVQSLASFALQQNSIAAPPTIGSQLLGDATSIAERNLRSARELARLAQAFSDAAVDLLFVKGITLSALVYGDPFLKMSGDIDIVIDPAAITDAVQILAGLGYRATLPAGETSSLALQRWHRQRRGSDWLHSKSGLMIDLHTALADNPALIPSIGMNSPRQRVTVGRWSFPTLSTEDLFAYLTVHGTWSAWYRLKWIGDVAGMVHRGGNGAAEQLYDHAISRGAGRAPGQALLLANHLFGTPLPARLRRELDRDPANAILKKIALRELSMDTLPTERTLGTLPMHSIRPFLRPEWNFKFSEIKRQVHDVIQRMLAPA